MVRSPEYCLGGLASYYLSFLTKMANSTRASPPCSLCLQKAVFEDVPLGTVILRVKATDADSGPFALIQYSLGDGEGKFGINPDTVRSQLKLEQRGKKGGEAEMIPPYGPKGSLTPAPHCLSLVKYQLC